MLGLYLTEQVSWRLDTVAPDSYKKVVWPPHIPLEDRDLRICPIILFGYFPYHSDVPNEWKPPWGPLNYWRRIAFKVLFQTGNPEPTVPFDETFESLSKEPDPSPSPGHSLARWRATKEFRACLWLHEIRLWEDGGCTKFEMIGRYDVGFTPTAVAPLVLGADGVPIDRKYTPGIGGPREKIPEAEFQTWGVRMPIEVGFRINERMPLIGNPLLFGSRVPFMRLILELEVHVDGQHRALFNGSYIPSQIYQAGGKVIDHYNMVKQIGNFAQIKRTVGAGLKAPAPDRGPVQWRSIP